MRGIGARAAVDQLHFVDQHNIRQGQGVVVLMLPGRDRWDMFWKQPRNHRGKEQPDGYNTGEYQHEKWRTAWPIPNQEGYNRELFGVYARDVWSIQFTALNMMMAILTCQTWCSAHGYDMIMCNAYGDQTPGVYEWLREHCGSLTDKWDWNRYLHHHTNYTSFLELLVHKTASCLVMIGVIIIVCTTPATLPHILSILPMTKALIPPSKGIN